jgi:hypothetical protein
VCDGLRVEPDADTKEDAPGNSFVHQMAALGRLIHEKIRGGLHHSVKRAMAIVRSRFEYDMDLIADGFITDLDRTNKENEVTCLSLRSPGVALQNFSRLRWSRPPTTRACEPKLGMRARVNELIFVTFVVMALGALKHLDVSLY